MSGHNKWSKIKHKKAVADQQKSKLFSKYVQRIKVESKKSGGDVESPGLRSAIASAKSVNMPASNIEKAIKSGVSSDSDTLSEVLYEAYGPGGVALIVDAVTDNNNRTAAEIKHIFSKRGLSVAAPGSSVWAFENIHGEWVPNTTITLSDSDSSKLADLLEELDNHDDVQKIYTNKK